MSHTPKPTPALLYTGGSPAEAAADPGTRGYREAPSIESLNGELPGRDVLVALGRRRVFVRTVRVPNAGDAEIRAYLQLQIGKLFPLNSGELAFTFLKTSDVNSEGRLAVVSACAVSVLREALDRLKAAQKTPVEVIPAAYGAVLLASASGLSEAAVVEATPEGFAIDVVSDGTVRASRVVAADLSPDALIAEVGRTYALASLPVGPVLAAGGLSLPGATGTPSRSIELLAQLGPGRFGPGLELPERVAAKERRRAQGRARLAILLCLAALTLGLMVFWDRSDEAEAARRVDARWEAQLRRFRNSRDAVSRQATSLSRITTSLDRGFAPAQRPSDVLTLVGNLAPSGLWLTGVTFERGKTLQIRGTATSGERVTAYVEALRAEERLRDVRLSFANNAQIDDTAVVNFAIQAHVVGNLPLVEPRRGRSAAR